MHDPDKRQPYGPTTLDSLFVALMTRQTTWPVPRGVQDGVPTPEPPTFNQPDQGGTPKCSVHASFLKCG
jgi:hypothetical protein